MHDQPLQEYYTTLVVYQFILELTIFTPILPQDYLSRANQFPSTKCDIPLRHINKITDIKTGEVNM